jgi:hypothetical protein
VKRSFLTYSAIIMMALFFAGVVFAEDFPAQRNDAPQVQAPGPSGQPQPFSGYVPPPPIRHTWPGGYKVIFHVMMNTLMDHIIGQY